jgi:hypothetical protein
MEGHLGLPSRLIGFTNSTVAFAISLRMFANILVGICRVSTMKRPDFVVFSGSKE